jgi:outer membrane protein OmpA-like peptidoglycan-associated protein
MQWSERKTQHRTSHGEAIHIALLLGGVALFALAAEARAQKEPLLLPTQHVTVPQQTFQPGQGAKVKGLIISRNGDDMMIRDETGYLDVITLTADTKISSPSGLFKTEKKRRDVTSLLPGLVVEVKGKGGSNGNLVADKISFHSSSLRTAQQMAAGDVMIKARIQQNKDSIDALRRRHGDSLKSVNQRLDDSLAWMASRVRDSLSRINTRFDDLDNYTQKDSALVNFATGKADLNDEGKRSLDALAARGMQMTGYLIEVRGYADTVGSSDYNQRLSQRRAQAVVDYLAKRNVPLRRVLNPTGLGESDPAASNSTKAGRALNRRAEVRVLVNGTQR